MTPYYQDAAVTLFLGDSFDVLKALPDASVDAIASDPPYGIGFMGREWDTFKPTVAAQKQGLRQINKSEKYSRKAKRQSNPNLKGRTVDGAISSSQIEYDYSLTGLRSFQAWCEGWARESIRVLKPGGYAVVCGAPRAYHRMASGLEDAGFEIRDCLAWLFGSGFPKSLNLGDGLGTALKPAHEPIVLARKPFKGTVAANVALHGTGALNIDACRIAFEGEAPTGSGDRRSSGIYAQDAWTKTQMANGGNVTPDLGRWPANVCLDDLAALVLDEQSGELTSGAWDGNRNTDKTRAIYGTFKGGQSEASGDVGGASRFYYVAKPSREERDYGCLDQPTRSAGACTDRAEGSAGLKSPRAGAGRTGGHKNFHPTVKPVELMRWLVRLVTPPNGIVLDPFLGSGTTGMACRYEQRRFIGIEREADYIEIAERRIRAVAPLFAQESA